jgi:hypothetical protein
LPTLDGTNIAFTLLKAAAGGLPVGPMLLGMSMPIHVLAPIVTARGIVNLGALAALGAGRVGPTLGLGSQFRWRRSPRAAVRCNYPRAPSGFIISRTD